MLASLLNLGNLISGQFYNNSTYIILKDQKTIVMIHINITLHTFLEKVLKYISYIYLIIQYHL